MFRILERLVKVHVKNTVLSHTRNVLLWVFQVNPQCIRSPSNAFVLIGICV